MRAIVRTGLVCILALNFLSCEQSEDYEAYGVLLEDISSGEGEDADPDGEDGPK